jgi:hypothetical protein
MFCLRMCCLCSVVYRCAALQSCGEMAGMVSWETCNPVHRHNAQCVAFAAKPMLYFNERAWQKVQGQVNFKLNF